MGRQVERVLDPLQRPGELEVRRRVVERITAQHEERGNLAAAHRVCQVAQFATARPPLPARAVQGDRLTQVAQGGIEQHRRGVDLGRLPLPGKDDALAAILQQVVSQRLDPVRLDAFDGREAGGGQVQRESAGAQFRGQQPQQAGQLPGAQPQPLIGVATGHGQGALDRPETAHRTVLAADTPALGKLHGVAHGLGIGHQEVGIEREHHRGPVEATACLVGLPEDLLTAGDSALFAERPVGDDPCLRVARAERVEQSFECRRGELLRQHGETLAAVRGEGLRQPGPGLLELSPGHRLARPLHGLQTVRIVEVEDCRLDPGTRGTERRGVQFVAFNLGRPTLVALHDQSVGAAAEGHRGCVVARDTRQQVFRRGHEGDDLLHRATTGGQARQRQGRAHQRQHGAPRNALRRLGYALGELTVLERAIARCAFLLRQASPVGLAGVHRWHPEQSTGGSSFFSSITRWANSA